jgi:transglycosylase-like protein with SLT domain
MAYRTRALVAAMVGLVLVAGCGLTGNDDDKAGDVAIATPNEPTFEPVTESPTPEVVETTSAPPTKPVKKPSSAAPTEEPFWEELPACAHRDKTKLVAKAKVKAALKTASAKIYWPTTAPTLKLNYPLVKAVAWMESGWQSNIHNCDGGAGIMQVMPATVEMINNRFAQSYDASVYQQNALIGANYLAWLAQWASERYFGDSVNLSASKCKTTTSWCLLNVVISGYNAGQGSIEQAAASKKLPNPQYVATVRALMTRCKCDQY